MQHTLGLLSALLAAFLVAFPSFAAGQQAAPVAAQASAEDVVVEQYDNDVTFAKDGTGRREQTARLRMQSESGVKAWGVISLTYRNDIERVERIEVRVRKPDGRVVTTPDSDLQDVAAEVTREAPTYTDVREKQAPVKSLGVGDVLEWRTIIIRNKPEAPGQFWDAWSFLKEGTVLEETLRVTVPAGKYAQVRSPGRTADVIEENGQRIYLWKSSHRDDPKEKDNAPKEPAHDPKPDVQVTSFRDWTEVGAWYDALQKPKVEASPAVRAKAAEITAGLKTEEEKARAIYAFVSAKFRYISLSLGEARYQPHSADEVLANQYGDCKDKHTLLAALLRAAGIEVWPALIGAGLGFDAETPSPAQFNHVITFLPHSPSPIWLDSTPEVAPYGLLGPNLRDRQALLIPAGGAARVVTTPAVPPFAAEEKVTVEGKLSAEGVFTARLNFTARGDDELVLRAIYHATAPGQWSTLTQTLANNMGFAGTVREVDVDNPANLDAPFHLSFGYERKDYGDWQNRRIMPALPPFVMLPTEDSDKPEEPPRLGMPGTTTYLSKIELPAGFSIEIPGNIKLQTPFADYTATYDVEKGVLATERTFVLKTPKLALDQWEDYRKFAKAVETDENQLLQLVRGDAGTAHVVRDVPAAAELVQRAVPAMQRGDLNAAREAFNQAERLNPEQANLWLARAMLYGMQNQNDRALEALRKELEYHPGNQMVYITMAQLQRQMGRKEDAIATLRRLVAIAPGDPQVVDVLATLLFDAKRYREAVEPLRTALKSDAENVRMGSLLVEALIRGDQKKEGLAELEAMKGKKLDAFTLNSLAWILADTNTEPAAAKELADRAVADYEAQLKETTIAGVNTDHFKAVDSLGAVWDTAGWAAFQMGDLSAAEKYIRAAWMLIQHPVAGDHLGQIYERQGRKAEAIRAYQLALAVKSDMPDTRARLEKLGGTPGDRPTLRRGKASEPPAMAPEEELSRMRTAQLPELTYRRGSADFFVLFSAGKVADARFITGDEALKGAAPAILKARFDAPFPDAGPEKIVRRGILSCSEYSQPACTFVLLLPANTTN